MNVQDGTMTSPSSFSARIAISSAIVPLHMATQCLTPSLAAMRCSNSCTVGPLLVNHWLSSIRSEEHTSELQSLMRLSYAVFCLIKQTPTYQTPSIRQLQPYYS